MLKLLTWKKLSGGTKAFRHGSTMRPMNASAATNRNSRRKNGDVIGSTFEAPAAGHEEAGGAPLEKENDRGENADLAEHRAEPRLENLIGDTDAEGRRHGADKIADAAEHHDHEAVED